MSAVEEDGKNKRNAQIFDDDHDDVEISIDEIEKGLFLGNATAARNLDVLRERNITYILTLDIVPLPECVIQKTHLTTKYIKISDMPKEDLLHVIDECIQFIKEALDNGKKILVHCYFGVSRSAAIVIAYIMLKYKASYAAAFERVKSRRRFIGPNPGFVQQLKLWRKMNYQIEPLNPHYKSYRLRLASNQVRKAKILPQTCMDVIKSDPGLTQENPEPIVYRCRKCRRVVASKSNLLLHKVQSNTNSNKKTKHKSENHENDDNNKTTEIKSNEPTVNISKTNTTPSATNVRQPPKTLTLVEQISLQMQGNCMIKRGSDESQRVVGAGEEVSGSDAVYCNKMFFVEPMAWMKDILTQTNGKLNCPKCSNKIGHFNWVGSSICPCGEQICPAFYLVPSKVELSKVVQNVQMTV